MKARLIIFLALGASVAWAQAGRCWQDPSDGYGKNLALIEAAKDDTALKSAVSALVDVGLDLHCFAEFAGQRAAIKSIMRAFENARTDKQAGAGASGAGTTSVISRGASAKALGFAAENGALTQSVKGQVVTFTGNLAGLPSVLARKDIFPYCDPRTGSIDGSCISSGALRFLRRVSFAVSFDASRDAQTLVATPAVGTTPAATTGTTTTPSPVTFQGSRHEISSVMGRFELVNRRDVTSKEYQKVWQDKVKTEKTLQASGTALLNEINGTMGPLLRSPEYIAWFRHATERMIAAGKQKQNVSQVWADLLSELVTTLRSSSKDFQDKVDQLRVAFQNFDLDEDSFIDTIGTKPLLTFEYTNNRPVGQTSISSFRAIGEFGWAQKNNLTFNFAAGIFDSAQPVVPGVSTSRLRDLEAGLQYERKLGQLGILGAGALDLSVYFQNQRSASILTVDPTQPLPGITFVGLPAGAKAVFAQKGNIGIEQLRLVLGPDKSNIRIPIAVSYSNRTELIDKPAWRAQIGISYDFDALFAK